jgi:uncharacterized protein YndB with AHSA1/START domain
MEGERRLRIMSRRKDTRGHVHEIEIEATPEAVWKAITDPAELPNWFPLSAEARPGPGGAITYRWGDELTAPLTILEWTPPRRLRTTWMEALMPAGSGAEERRRVAVDWVLEGSGGRTVLRLVHSGFDPGASWDDEFDGTRRGWTFELRSLRHYLERHPGVPRRAFWVRAPIAGGPAAAWDLFTRRIVREGTTEGLTIDSSYRFVLATGDVLEGEATVVLPPTDFSGTDASRGDALWRFGYEPMGGAPEVHLWYSAWGRPTGETAALEERWKAMLNASR